MRSDEADRIGLAPAAADIAKIEVASDPTAGKGYAINSQGHIPIVAQSGNWTMEYVPVTFDIPSLTAHTGSSESITIPGLRVNDLCIFIGRGTTQAVQGYTDTVCQTENTIVVRFFNTSASTSDPSEQTLHFLVIHRFL